MFELMRLHNTAKFFYRAKFGRLKDSDTVWIYAPRPSYLEAPLLARPSDGIATRFYSRFSSEKRKIFYCFFFRFQNYFKTEREHTPSGEDVKTFAIDTASNTRHFRESRSTNHVRNVFFGFAGQYTSYKS